MARRVRWRRGRPRQDELTTLAAIVDLVPDDIPEVGGQLPLIDEAWRRAREEGSGVEGGQIPHFWPGVHADVAPRVMERGGRLAAASGTLEQDAAKCRQHVGHCLVSHPGAVVHDENVPDYARRTDPILQLIQARICKWRWPLDLVNKVAILIAMSIAEQLPLAEVKNRLSEVVEQVESQHARVTITKHGRPAAVVISAEDLESLEETLRVLSDPDLLAQVRASRAESDAAVTLDRNEALAMLGTGA